MWKSRGSTVQTGRTILQEYKSTAMYEVFRVNSFVCLESEVQLEEIMWKVQAWGHTIKKIHKLC